jgi:hypothetical protein
MRYLFVALERHMELVLLSMGSGDGLHRVGNGGVLLSNFADGRELLRRLSGFKN